MQSRGYRQLGSAVAVVLCHTQEPGTFPPGGTLPGKPLTSWTLSCGDETEADDLQAGLYLVQRVARAAMAINVVELRIHGVGREIRY